MDNSPASALLLQEQIGKWLDSSLRREWQDATYYAEEVGAVGRVVTSHPEFQRLYAALGPAGPGDPHEALDGMRRLLAALTVFSRTSAAPARSGR